MSGANTYDIFISYTHDDVDAAKRLAEELKLRGWSVYWDRELLPGATWRTQIQSALAAAKVVVVMWSQKAGASRWVEIEADHAFQRDAYLPVKIDNSPVPLGFSHVQVADLRQWHADPSAAMPKDLALALQHRLGSPVVSVAVAAAPAVSDPVFRFSGIALDGATCEIAVRLSQLREKREGLVIGRAADQADLIVSHASVSRRHAVLTAVGERLAIADLGSTNGTYVDDKPAPQGRPLEFGRDAVIRLGDVDLRCVNAAQ